MKPLTASLRRHYGGRGSKRYETNGTGMERHAWRNKASRGLTIMVKSGTFSRDLPISGLSHKLRASCTSPRQRGRGGMVRVKPFRGPDPHPPRRPPCRRSAAGAQWDSGPWGRPVAPAHPSPPGLARPDPALKTSEPSPPPPRPSDLRVWHRRQSESAPGRQVRLGASETRLAALGRPR